MDEDINETAVRNYLLYLQDPALLLDRAEIERLEALAVSSADPLERLRAVTDLQRARDGDEASYLAGFVASAKAWAESNGIPPASFVEVGVDRAVLREAGFDVKHLRVAHVSGSGRSQQPKAASKGESVRVEVVKSTIRATKGPFTLAQIAEFGGSQMTVRKAVEALVSEGEVERLGPDPEWSSQGRAPIVFQLGKVKAKSGRR